MGGLANGMRWVETLVGAVGLVTTCIDMGPVRVLSIGALADAIGSARAIPVMATAGLPALAVTARLTLRR